MSLLRSQIPPPRGLQSQNFFCKDIEASGPPQRTPATCSGQPVPARAYLTTRTPFMPTWQWAGKEQR